MKKIIVQKPNDRLLVSQLVSLYHSLKDLPYNEPRIFDLSGLDFFNPLLTLPLSAHISCYSSQCIKNESNSYLDTICFPTGVDAVSLFEHQIQQNKNYIPISVLKRDKGADRERLESLFSSMVYKIIGSVAGAQNAVHYPITELVTNIFDHSKHDKGFIFGQFYPSRNYLDVCIVDCGRGLAKAYEEENGLKLSDEDAILEVLRGHSTKPSVERGYGVRTSKRVVCEGLGGEFILLSGSTALVVNGAQERLIELPGFYWQGVIVAYRIPRPNGPVDISPYLE